MLAGRENSEQARFRPDIEGLRAIAVGAVVLFHAVVPGVKSGFVGVDVFFIISGFLITGMLWREAGASGTVSLRRFWGARARRLLPASATVGIVTMIASALVLSPLQVKTVAVDAITSALYVSNYWFIASGLNYFGKDNLVTPSPFQHYWSLGVEEQFYLIWPVLIILVAWLVRRLRRGGDKESSPRTARPYIAVLAVVVVLSFLASLVLTYLMPPAAYLSLPTRAWQLSIGGLVALTAAWWRRLPSTAAAVLGWVGLAMIVVSCVALDAASYPGTAALLPTFGTALVIGAGCANATRGCGRLLSLAPMRAVGRMSYSWYLWHWPVLVLVPAFMGHPASLPVRLAAAAASAVLAMVTLRFVENPLRFADRIRRSPRNSLALGGVATAMAVGVAVVALVGTPAPVGPGPAVPPLVINAAPTPPGLPLTDYDDAVESVFGRVNAAVRAAMGTTLVPSNLAPPLTGTTAEVKSIVADGCLRSLPFDASQPECVTGNRSSATTAALIGDSHAGMWHPALQRAVDERGWRMLLMAKVSCPIVDLPLTDKFNGLSEQVQRCAQWREGIMARLRAEPPALVIVAAVRAYSAQGIGVWFNRPGFDPFNAAWVDGLAHLVRELRGHGSQVLVLGPEPGFASPAPTCLSSHLENAKACQTTWPAGFDAGIARESAAVRAAGGQYASTKDLFCADDRCPPIVGNAMVFYDASHISSEYSTALGPAVGALADRALAQH